MRYLLRLRRCMGGFDTPKDIRTRDFPTPCCTVTMINAIGFIGQRFFMSWPMGVVHSAGKNEIERSLTNAKDFSSCSHSTALKAAIGSGDVVEASVPTALQTHVCLFYCACCFNTLGGALCSDRNVHFDEQLPVSLGATCPDASVHVHVGFPLQTPDCFRVTGKLRETRSQSVSN